MHAYGNAEMRRVFIESGGRMAVPPMTIEEAQQLQRQLGVAIGEAAGQQRLLEPAEYEPTSWSE